MANLKCKFKLFRDTEWKVSRVTQIWVATRGESKPEQPGAQFRWNNYCRYGVPLRVSSTLIVICICFSVFVQFTFFTMPLTKHSTKERMHGLKK